MKFRRFTNRLTARPEFFLAIIALLTSLIVQPGNLGSVDTGRRLQVTHSLWTSEPAVIQEGPDDEFGVVGRSGQLQPWFGIGQSLLMLIPDIIAGTLVNSVSPLREVDRRENGSIRRTLVAYQISPLVCVLAVLMGFHLIQLLGFGVHEAIAGAITLLFGTTFLHYTQIAQENNYILLLTLLGFYFQLRWFRENRFAFLIVGAMALGLNLLTRLTTSLDLLAAGLFVAGCFWHYGIRGRLFWRRLATYLLVCVPIYGSFLLADRLYHFYRFGTVSGTYIHLFGEKWKLLHPELPSSFPFSTPFLVGFAGPLVTPEKSIFIFDPLIVLTAILFIRFRKEICGAVKPFVVVSVGLLFAYICFYATFFVWSGDAAWGDRYITTPVHFLAMISVPLLLHFRHRLKGTIEKGIYWSIAALSAVIQIASLPLSYNVELIQVHNGLSRFIVGLRFLNLFAMANDRFEAWGLANGIPERLRAINLMPFGPAQSLPAPAGVFLMLFWIVLLIALFGTVFVFVQKMRGGDFLNPQAILSNS